MARTYMVSAEFFESENEFGYTMVGLTLLIGAYLWWYFGRKKPHRLEYFRRLCISLHYINDVATNIEQMISMIQDIENTPRKYRKPLTIAIPDTLSHKINTGNFTVRNVRDADIFVKLIDSQCCELCDSLLDMLQEAISTGTITADDIDYDIPDIAEGEELGSISVSDHQLGEFEI